MSYYERLLEKHGVKLTVMQRNARAATLARDYRDSSQIHGVIRKDAGALAPRRTNKQSRVTA